MLKCIIIISAAIKDIALAITPIVAILFGLGAYQRQQRWHAKLKMARRFIRLSRKVELSLQSIRNPVNTTEEDQRRLLQELVDTLATLRGLLWESEVLFSRQFDIQTPAATLYRIYNEVRIAHSVYFGDKSSPKYRQQVESTVFGLDDEIEKEVTEAVSEIKQELRSELDAGFLGLFSRR
jgi:hypothetical protein